MTIYEDRIKILFNLIQISICRNLKNCEIWIPKYWVLLLLLLLEKVDRRGFLLREVDLMGKLVDTPDLNVLNW